MPIFETAKERSQWLSDHASYFTITWMENRKHHTYYYSKLRRAQINARIAADHIAKKPVLIYAIYCPDDTTEVGLSTWVETIYPKKWKLRSLSGLSTLRSEADNAR